MSKCASIDIQFHKYNQLDFLELMVESGWSHDFCGFKNYFPIGNDDDYVLENKKISDSELMQIMQKKIELNEVVGISMTWGDTEVGGDFFLKSDSASIALAIGSIRINSSRLLDVNWYIDKIIYPTTLSEKIIIDHFEYFEDSIH